GYQPGQVLPERVQVRLRQELGDLLFTLVNLARWIRVDPEEALREMVTRFSSRFREMEARAAAGNRTLAEMTMDEREELWVAAKEALG
ncbi:MAG: hypothetical protein FJ315_06360, partial [SAR202 cluster bacterium]|nr:hypothetical protein [SAR202 cluster bacterium]